MRYFKQYNPDCYWRFNGDRGEVSPDGTGGWTQSYLLPQHFVYAIETDENWNSLTEVRKEFGKDFHSEGGALTLSPGNLGTHDSGWTIEGEVHEDYYEWINDFEAFHDTYGRVAGNFESMVVADSEEAFQHFYENHTPSAWDYQDI